MSAGPVVDASVAWAIERLRGEFRERMGRLEERLDAVQSTLEHQSRGAQSGVLLDAEEAPPRRVGVRGATAGAISAGAVVGLFEALRRIFS